MTMTTLTQPSPTPSPAPEQETAPAPVMPARPAVKSAPAAELAPAVKMAPAVAPPPLPALPVSATDGPPAPYCFTVTQYYAMGRAEIIRDDERVELLEGVIVAMSPIGGRHMATVDRFTRTLVQGLGERAIVRVQGSIVLNYLNSPEPDLVVLRERADFYESGFALPSDVLLLIEVSDSTQGYDRRIKLPLYARAEIPEVWLAVVQETVRRLEVYTDPDTDGARYATMRTLGLDDTIAPAAFPDLAVPVGRMLAAGPAG